jgi:hypothetical protein
MYAGAAMLLRQLRRVLIVAFVLSVAVPGAVAASSAGWSGTRELVAPTVQTFSPELAVNHAGVAVAAWFSGPGPPVSASFKPQAATGWTGNKVVVSVGSITNGLSKPAVIAKDGTDLQGEIKVAVSGAGVAYVAWRRSDGPGAMIVTARGGHLSSLRVLSLPRGAHLQRLAHGLDGPVDALSYRGNGHGFTFFCTQLKPNGSSGRTIVAAHAFRANPCHLPDTSGMQGSIPPDTGSPTGYERAAYSVVSRTDGTNAALAVWDDFPENGPGYTWGLFYAQRQS